MQMFRKQLVRHNSHGGLSCTFSKDYYYFSLPSEGCSCATFSHIVNSSSQSFPLNIRHTMLCLLHNSVPSREGNILPHNENNHCVTGHVGGWPRLVYHWLSVDMWTIIYGGIQLEILLVSLLWWKGQAEISLSPLIRTLIPQDFTCNGKSNTAKQVRSISTGGTNRRQNAWKTNIQMQTQLICFAKWHQLKL